MPGPALCVDVTPQCSQQASKQRFVKQSSQVSCHEKWRERSAFMVKASSSPAKAGLSTADMKKAKLESMAGLKHGLDK